MPLIAGVDDAGRGPVLGPLVVAGVLFYDYQIPRLQALGIKDSKALTPSRRRILADNIRELAVAHELAVCSPKEIDKAVLEGKKFRKLNWLEAKAMAKVISILEPDIAYVDASDVLEWRFGEHICEMLEYNPKVISEHHADAKYPVVSAASIIAKTHRDEMIAQLQAEYGDFGSGYCSDLKTRQFLVKWMLDHKEENLPHFVRKSWKTIRILKTELRQAEITSFTH